MLINHPMDKNLILLTYQINQMLSPRETLPKIFIESDPPTSVCTPSSPQKQHFRNEENHELRSCLQSLAHAPTHECGRARRVVRDFFFFSTRRARFERICIIGATRPERRPLFLFCASAAASVDFSRSRSQTFGTERVLDFQIRGGFLFSIWLAMALLYLFENCEDIYCCVLLNFKIICYWLILCYLALSVFFWIKYWRVSRQFSLECYVLRLRTHICWLDVMVCINLNYPISAKL